MCAVHLLAGPVAKASDSNSCQTSVDASAKAEANSQANSQAEAEAHAQTDRKTLSSKGLQCWVHCQHVRAYTAA